MTTGETCVNQQRILELGTENDGFLQMVQHILFFALEHIRQFRISEEGIVHLGFKEFIGFRIFHLHLGQDSDCPGKRTEKSLLDLEFD